MNWTRIAVSSGHGQFVAGASGVDGIQEVPEARRVVTKVVQNLRDLSPNTQIFEIHDNVSRTQAANLTWLVNEHNRVANNATSLNVSIHFNHAGGGLLDRAIGTEVLFVTQNALAARVSKAIADVSGLINRGGKHRTNLGWLNRTSRPSILVEVLFLNSRPDVAIWRRPGIFDAICQAIAASILGRPTTPTAPPTQLPPTQQRVCPHCGQVIT
jgi:N-acetylmuramoyl-L-alanine amidase